MKTPLEVRVPLSKVTPKQPKGRKSDYFGMPSAADKNRVEPKTVVTSKTRASLEAVKPIKNAPDFNTVKPQRAGYTAPREEIPWTVKGYPKRRFKGSVQPNVPQ